MLRWVGHIHVEGPQPPKHTPGGLTPCSSLSKTKQPCVRLSVSHRERHLISDQLWHGQLCALGVPFLLQCWPPHWRIRNILVPQTGAPPMLLCCCYWRSQEQGPRVPVALPFWGGWGKTGAGPRVLGSCWGRGACRPSLTLERGEGG